MRVRTAGAIVFAAMLGVAACDGDEQEQDVQPAAHGPAPMPADAPVDGLQPATADSTPTHATPDSAAAPPTTTH